MSYRSASPEVLTGLSTDGIGNGALNAGGSATALRRWAPVTDGRRDNAAAADSPVPAIRPSAPPMLSTRRRVMPRCSRIAELRPRDRPQGLTPHDDELHDEPDDR